MLTTDTVTLPAHWASAIFNGDESGLEEEDANLLQKWYEENPGLDIVDVGEPYFSHDIGDGSGLAGDVADYFVLHGSIIGDVARTTGVTG